MSWLSDYRFDVAKYQQLNGGSALKQILTEQGLWALLQYRLDAAVYRSQLPWLVKRPLRLVLTLWHKLVELTTGICLPCTVIAGPGLHLPHCGARVVNGGTVLGADCCISQGVTIGISGRGEHRGVPRIGNRVYLAANAVVAGKIVVGDDVVVGANSTVTRDVPAHCTVQGVPAVVVSQNGSADYITVTKPVRNLLVVARMKHYRHEGKLHAYAPYAREIDIWAELFPVITIAGNVYDAPPPGDCAAFAHDNITVLDIADAAGRVAQLWRLPRVVWQLMCAMRRAEAIHVRCPCDLGLLGVLLGPIFSRRLYAKYATDWTGFAGEPATWRLQRWLLRSRWWGSPVTVYGAWPNQPPHVVPFFTSVLRDEQIARARAAVRQGIDGKVRVLFVGRLSKSKNVDVLLEAVAAAKSNGTRFECTIVGDGPERAALQARAAQLGLNGRARFVGGVSFERVLEYYEQSDVLALVSDLEGWPKAVAEGMAFGLVCIGSDRGMIPQMLGDGRGLVVPPRDARALASELELVAADPARSVAMAQRAAAWSQQHSLEGLRDALRTLLQTRWGVTL